MNRNNIICYYQNVRGLRTKLLKLHKASVTADIDIIILTETWLNQNFLDVEILDDRYVIFRADRNASLSSLERGGGALIGVNMSNSNICVVSSSSYSTCNFEAVQVGLKMSGKMLFLTAVYFSPTANLNDFMEFVEYMENNPELIIHDNVIVGDFNISDVKGINYDFTSGNANARSLSNLMALLNLRSCNNVLNFQGKTLDLLLSSTHVVVQREFYPLLSEDVYHPCLLFKCDNLYVDVARSVNIQRPYLNFKKANFKELYFRLSHANWEHLFSLTDPNAAVDYFYSVLNDAIYSSVPMNMHITKSKFPTWFTRELIVMVKLKNRLARKRKLSKHYLNRFRVLRSEIKRVSSRAYKMYMVKLQDSVKTNVKEFWNYVNSRRRTTMLRDTFKLNDVRYPGANLAQGFADHFSSVFVSQKSADSSLLNQNHVRDPDLCHRENGYPEVDMLNINFITIGEVRDALRMLKAKKSCGPDGIPSYITKGCADLLVTPLTHIINTSIQSGVFPSKWKMANVSPIFKTGDEAEISNYRPIAILNACAKVYERVLFKLVYNHVKNYISSYQHGFMPGRSTITNLLLFTDFISCELDSASRVDAIYLDFKKAFDRVNHAVLLNKLRKFGFSNLLLKLFASYLQGRSLQVIFGHFKSEEFFSNIGVPQGSNLGPLLFLLMINDLPDRVKHSKILLFADDVKLYNSIANEDDMACLQEDLVNISEWCRDNDMDLNAGKCKFIIFTRKTDFPVLNYNINGIELERVNVIRDLGVLLDSELSFKYHIDNLVNAGNKLLGFVIRNTRYFTDIATSLLLFNSLVRSKLEYASEIWNPSYNTCDNSIERIQNKFLRYLYFKKHHVKFPLGGHVGDLRSSFSVSKLLTRRKLADLVFLYKIVNSLINSSLILENVKLVVPRSGLRPTSKLFYVPRVRTAHRQQAFLIRACALANELDGLDLFAVSVGAFASDCLGRLTLD